MAHAGLVRISMWVAVWVGHGRMGVATELWDLVDVVLLQLVVVPALAAAVQLLAE